MGIQMRNVHMSYEHADLLPATDSAFIDYQNFLHTFGQEGNVMVVAVEDSNFFELNKINDWIKMGNDITALKGVTALISATHLFNLYKDTEHQRFEVREVFPDSVESQHALDSLADIIRNLPFYNGTLYSLEQNTYGMMITVAADVMNSPDRVRLVKEIRSVTDNFCNKHQIEMHYSGMPYIRVVNAENIKFEMYLFIVLSLLITTIILYFFFRSWRTVLFCVGIIGLCVIWAVGYMALFNIKITLLTAMLPPLLIVIGIPNCVFMINKYHTEYMLHGNQIRALQRMVQKIGNNCLLSNITTAAGFATFIITSSQILVDFGIIAFASITTEFFISVILIPAIFGFLPPPEEKQTKHLKNVFINDVLHYLNNLVKNHRNYIYWVSGSFVAVSIVGMSLMKTTGYMVDDLKPSDPIRQDLSFFESHFNGLMPLEITVDFHKPQQALSLTNLRKLEELNDEIRKDPDISRSVSIVEVTKFASQAFYNGNPAYYKLPTSINRNFILKYVVNSNTSTGAIANSFIDTTYSKVRLSFRIKDIGTLKMEEATDTITHILSRIFPPDKTTTKVTGSSVIFFKGNQYLIKNLLTSLTLAILLIALFMAWMFKNRKMVIIALIPNIIPLLTTAAIMGFTGIPIKASTILVFSVAFGISVDGTIHYLAKYRQELQATNWNIKVSVANALQETGKSMIYTSIILFFGFGIFAFSNFGGTFALGVLTSITLFAAMLANLILLPAMLLTMEKRTTLKSFRAEPLLELYNEDEDIDSDKLQIK